MPTLFKRSNGIFYFVRIDESGRRRWISTGQSSKHLALSTIRDLTSPSKPKIPRRSLSEFKEEFLTYAESVFAPGTVDIYRRSLSSFIRITGNPQLSAVRQRDVDVFSSKELRLRRPTTVSLELRSLRAAFYVAQKWEYIAKNPFTGVKLPKDDERIPVFLTREDLSSLLKVIPYEWYRALVTVAVLTGLRRSELVFLRWSDVDLGRRLLHVQSQETHRTKTGHRRIVPLNPPAMRILQGLSSNGVGEHVFSPDGRSVNPQHVSRVFRRFVKRAKLRPELHFHCLRHTFATWLVQDGVSIYQVQRLLGHSTIRVTEMYSHLVPEDLHRSVDRISWN